MRILEEKTWYYWEIDCSRPEDFTFTKSSPLNYAIFKTPSKELCLREQIPLEDKGIGFFRRFNEYLNVHGDLSIRSEKISDLYIYYSQLKDFVDLKLIQDDIGVKGFNSWKELNEEICKLRSGYKDHFISITKTEMKI